MTKDLILESIKEYQKEIDKLKERKMKTLEEILKNM